MSCCHFVVIASSSSRRDFIWESPTTRPRLMLSTYTKGGPGMCRNFYCLWVCGSFNCGERLRVVFLIIAEGVLSGAEEEGDGGVIRVVYDPRDRDRPLPCSSSSDKTCKKKSRSGGLLWRVVPSTAGGGGGANALDREEFWRRRQKQAISGNKTERWCCCRRRRRRPLSLLLNSARISFSLSSFKYGQAVSSLLSVHFHSIHELGPAECRCLLQKNSLLHRLSRPPQVEMRIGMNVSRLHIFPRGQFGDGHVDVEVTSPSPSTTTMMMTMIERTLTRDWAVHLPIPKSAGIERTCMYYMRVESTDSITSYYAETIMAFPPNPPCLSCFL